MLHFAPRARAGTALFDTWEEARALWDALACGRGIVVLVLMPDHVHAIVDSGDAVRRLRHGMTGFALWRNRRRGESGAVWRHREPITIIRGRRHVARSKRYAYLNPCRAGLVEDPLAWCFSTYRDALGLALPRLHRASFDPAGLHARVSSDPSVRVDGTALPSPPPPGRGAALGEVLAAVSSLMRVPRRWVIRPGAGRNLLVSAARALTGASSEQIAAFLGIDASRVRALWRCPLPGVETVARVLGDPRFAVLGEGRLSLLPGWAAYLARPSARPSRDPHRSGGPHRTRV